MPRIGLESSRFRHLVDLDEGCVCSYCPIASAIGTRTLRQGGNAVDAAIATGLALAVSYPQAGNLGGGGFMLIKAPGEPAAFVDYRESAPRRASPDMFTSYSGSDLSSKSLQSGLAVATPGTIAGFAAALARYGTWSWDRLVASAIDLAETGTWVTNRQATYFSLYKKELMTFGSTRKAFCNSDQLPFPGDLMRQPDLGATLRTLADLGPEAFYRGTIAERIASTIKQCGGILDEEDLATYAPIWREPLSRKVFKREITTAPLPSGGGLVLLLSLALAEAAGVHRTAPGSVDRHDLLGRIFRVAFKVRSEICGDPAAMAPADLEACQTLVNTTFDGGSIDKMERDLGLHQERGPKGPSHPSCTTHFVVVDSSGMAVSNTYSLNTLFGSKLVAEGTGVLLNNTIDDFGISPGMPNWYRLFEGRFNLIGPGRRPAGSMCPTLVLNDGVPEVAIGASGGPRIPTAVVQTLLGILSDGMGLAESMEMPRVHHQHRPSELHVEDAVGMPVAEDLERRGFDVVLYPRLGIVAGLQFDRQANKLAAHLDSRF